MNDLNRFDHKRFLHFQMGFSMLETLARDHLLAMCQKMGVFLQAGECQERTGLAQRLDIQAKYSRLFDCLMAMLIRAEIVVEQGPDIVAAPGIGLYQTPEALNNLTDRYQSLLTDYPELRAHVDLLSTTLAQLPDILHGQVLATDILFPQGSLTLVDGIYQNNVVADQNNALVAANVRSYVAALVADLAADETVNIVEIGAGTGSSSAVVLEALADYQSRVNYVYTDISAGFIQHGKERFAPKYPFTHYQLLDIETEPGDQNYQLGSYDAVIATNVLHATKNIRQTLRHLKKLLKTNGWLILNELTCVTDFASLTFGLLNGWWLYEDANNRLPGSPLLSVELWQRILIEEGFRCVAVIKPFADLDQAKWQHVLVAESDGVWLSDVAEYQLLENPPTSAITNDDNHVTAHSDDSEYPNDRLGKSATLAAKQSHPNDHNQSGARSRVEKKIIATLATILNIDQSAFDQDGAFTDFGVDSILAVEVVNKLNEELNIGLRTTDLYNYASIDTLARHILATFSDPLPTNNPPADATTKATTNPQAQKRQRDANNCDNNHPVDIDASRDAIPPHFAESTGSPRVCAEDIAIVGMSGQFPGAHDLTAYWQNLANGTDSVTEIPPDRWSMQHIYSQDRDAPNKSYCRWGGFLEDIDCFDHKFFNISPREALAMDPQQRLFLQVAWSALEDAGLSDNRLANTKCGVFVGCSQGDYRRRVNATLAPDAYTFMGNSGAILAARISYFLDLKGPSLAIDTACSSSLVAIHTACESILAGTCDLAIAGGVTVLTTEEFFVMASKAGMLSATGRCRTFADQADGFVPGEGVGAIILKSLSAALADGDPIHGIIKGIGVNQDGRTNGITAPSAPAQTTLECEVYAKSGIDPLTINYIETHGTGTKLGDPIEVAALTDAFRTYTDKKNYCALGSVKTNIGHSLMAAGIASVIKVLLALKHKQTPPSLHCDQENRHIDFKNSPFYVNTALTPWQCANDQPRRAAISSFGFSGTNCHMIIEEPGVSANASLPAANPSQLIVLSAKNEAALKHKIGDLAVWLEDQGSRCQLADIANTLLLGRSHFSWRGAMVVNSIAELAQQLSRIHTEDDVDGFLQTPDNGAHRPAEPALTTFGKSLLHQFANAEVLADSRDEYLLALADLFVKGYQLDWQQLCNSVDYRLLAMPTYPFANARFWAATTTAHGASQPQLNGGNNLHPVLHRNVSTMSEQCFASQFNGREFFLNDHIVSGARVLPAAVYLEMARVAGTISLEKPISGIRNSVWMRPLIVENTGIDVICSLYPDADSVRFLIHSIQDGLRIEHASGYLEWSNTDDNQAEQLDIAAITARLSAPQDPAFYYRLFHDHGLDYGSNLQSITRLLVGPREVLASLAVRSHPDAAYGLHPAILDGALQAVIGILHADTSDSSPFLPYAIQSVRLLGTLPQKGYAYITALADNNASDNKSFDIVITDLSGTPLVITKGCAFRALSESAPPKIQVQKDPAPLFYAAPAWCAMPLEKAPNVDATKEGIVVVFDDQHGLVKKLSSNPDVKVITIRPGPKYQALADDCYQINPEVENDYRRLLQSLDTSLALPIKIIQLWPMDIGHAPDSESYRIEQGLLHGFYPMLFFIKVLLTLQPKADVRCVLCYPLMVAESDLFQSLAGFLRSAYTENTGICGSIVGIETPLPERRVLAALINDELTLVADQITNRVTDRVREVKYAGKHRFIKSYSEILPNSSQPLLLKTNGVYLIIGGLGGIGRLFAEHLGAQLQAHLVLVGRTPISTEIEAQLEMIRTHAGSAHYLQADIAKRLDVFELIAQVKLEHANINGVIHSAGIIDDARIVDKSKASTKRVLAAKIFGTVYLDEALSQEPIDFFVLFSGIAAVNGNPGQADYAFANRFLDCFAATRNKKCTDNTRFGQTLSINWPLWQDGGMHIEKSTEQWLTTVMGMAAMPSAAGIEAFCIGLAWCRDNILVAYGDHAKLRRALDIDESLPAPAPDFGVPIVTADPPNKHLHNKIAATIITLVSSILRVEASEVNVDTDFGEYGFDSISLTELTNHVNKEFSLELTPALFFEYVTIEQIVDHLCVNFANQLNDWNSASDKSGANHGQTGPWREQIDSSPNKPKITEVRPAGFRRLAIPAYVDPGHHAMDIANASASAHTQTMVASPRHAPDDIAIIGMSGIMPQSPDLDSFWQNLINKKNMVSEIPKERWDWRQYYGDPAKEADKTDIKWGGFIDDIDCFDALFFGISPSEAELMDPQQRLFMQTVYKTIEDAGYKPADLSGSKTGLFVGVAANDYGDLLHDNAVAIEAQSSTGLSHAVLANRISYLLNIHGPSEPIDTACSSSLVAIHRAVTSIHNGDCTLAIAGGVNLILLPTSYIAFSKAGMLSKDGRCRAFDRDANGYVRGEGIGALLLKPLAQAKADGDTITAVIKATAINHGGHANSLTAPNPNAQADLLINAYQKAGIAPETVSYIEAHGTGTSLGDPIEINGLQKAFAALQAQSTTPPTQTMHCGIGSVKSNIGHLETAAGIAGVLKVLLAMRHQILPGNIHYHTQNPYIKLADSPFYIVDKQCPWQAFVDENGVVPRRAGVSSFGFGGVNAHVVLEAYEDATTEPNNQANVAAPAPQLIVLSAKDDARLHDYSLALWQHLQDHSYLDQQLADIAFTLQVGREAMASRLAIITATIADLQHTLACFNDGKKVNNLFHGNLADLRGRMEVLIDGKEGTAFLRQLSTNQKIDRLGRLWVEGIDIDWSVLHDSQRKRLSLPTYPFAKTRYWMVPSETGTSRTSLPSHRLHPLIGQNMSDFAEQKFTTHFNGNEFFLRDHVINSCKTMPGVALVEMARAAGEIAGQQHVNRLVGITWVKPIVVDDGIDISISLQLLGDDVGFTVVGDDEQLEPVMYAHGRLQFRTATTPDTQPLDIAAIRTRCLNTWTPDHIYRNFSANGLDYGTCLQSIKTLWANTNEALAHLVLPERVSSGFNDFGFHPALLDGALQAVIGLIAGGFEPGHPIYLPYAIKTVEFVGDLRQTAFAHVTPTASANKLDPRTKGFDISICDENGNVAIIMNGLLLKSISAPHATLLFRPQDEAAGELPENQFKSSGDVVVFSANNELAKKLREHEPQSAQSSVVSVRFGDSFAIAKTGDFVINSQDRTHYDRLVGSWEGLEDERRIVFVWPHWQIAETPPTPTATLATLPGVADLVTETVRQALYPLLYLTQALLQQKSVHAVRLIIIYPATLPSLTRDLSTALAGFIKTVYLENAQFLYKLVQVVPGGDGDETAGIDTKLLSEILSYELTHTETHDFEVCYRDRKRLVKRLVSFSAPSAATSVPSFREQGVYLLTGGAGAMATVFAEYLARVYHARLILVGRQQLQQEISDRLANLQQLGAEAMYLQANITDPTAVADMVARAKQQFGVINGVIHCAGVIHDGFLLKKTSDQINAVLQPKIVGTVVLDAALQAEQLDFFVMSSSIAAVTGNVGQGDYAFANSFLDSFAHTRNALCSTGQRFGTSLAINWPLWDAGGMQVDANRLALLSKTTGMRPLSQQAGIDVLTHGLQAQTSQIIVAAGEKLAITRYFLAQGRITEEQSVTDHASIAGDTKISSDQLAVKTQNLLRTVLAETTKLEINLIDPQAPFEQYGIDSLMIMKLNQRLEGYFGKLSATLFFEYQTLAELSQYFCKHQRSKLEAMFYQLAPANESAEISNPLSQAKQPPSLAATGTVRPRRFFADIKATGKGINAQSEIAIIGIDGRYPKASNLTQFWENLKSGLDCITEIPQDRWNYRSADHIEDQKGGKTASQWGGFIDDVDRFDSLLFNISPREARLLDPQERLFLEIAWATMEDAGYKKQNLKASTVGVFVGVMWGHYQLLGIDPAWTDRPIASSSSYASIANRVSYFFDFHGPSMAIDSMCSSSLTAIHLACESIRRGESDVALAGGVNVTVHPQKYRQLALGNFVASDGRCRSFGAGGDGYVPGEGVGAVLLKPLHQAITDGDHIKAVIKGSAINHGGKTNSYTVPNPNAQSQVISKAQAIAGVGPESIGYIEAHGTGTALGDPIEIAGLVKAFNDRNRQQPSCAIGSVKSNIGHLESAAGIAGLTKVVLQLQHQQMVPSLHAATLNPNINFADTPFHVQRELNQWSAITTPTNDPDEFYPRRAGLSSFGAGGANAHFIIEEYIDNTAVTWTDTNANAQQRFMFVLSAQSTDRLQAYAATMADFIRRQHALPVNAPRLELADIVYTLQLGREAMAVRFVGLVTTSAELLHSLEQLMQGRIDSANCYCTAFADSADDNKVATAGTDLEAAVNTAMQQHNLDRLAEIWISGIDIDWQVFYAGLITRGGKQPKRVSLPTYPFARERHWLTEAKPDFTNQGGHVHSPVHSPAQPLSHPLIDTIDFGMSMAAGLVFHKQLKPETRIIQDHVVNNQPLLAGVAQIEMVHAAMRQCHGISWSEFTDWVWLQPIVVGDQQAVNIVIKNANASNNDAGEVRFSIEDAHDSGVVYSQGRAEINTDSDRDRTDNVELSAIDEIKARCQTTLDGHALYQQFSLSGIDYGAVFQVLEKVWVNGTTEALAMLRLKDDAGPIEPGYWLHPGLFDGALQTVGVLLDNSSGGYWLPFSVARVQFYGKLESNGYAYVRKTSESCFDIVISDANQRLCVRLSDFSIRKPKDALDNFFYVPTWVTAPQLNPPDSAAITKPSKTVLLLCPEHADAMIAAFKQAYAHDRLIVVIIGTHSRSQDGDTGEIEAGNSAAIAAVVKQMTVVDEIVFCGGIDLVRTATSSNFDIADLEQSQERGVLTLFRLIKALATNNIGANGLDLRVITNQVWSVLAGDRINPNAAALIGFVKSLAREYAKVRVSCIDIALPSQQEDTLDWQQLVNTFVAEPCHAVVDEVAVRQGRRYRREILPIMIPPTEPVRWQQEGVYLIIGGASGIGIELSRYLALKVKARLILVGRRKLDNATQAKLAEIESCGAKVVYKRADMTDRLAMQQVVAYAKETFGHINGVVHSAIVLQDQLIAQMSETDLRAVLAPKVKGSVILADVLRNESLDFLLFFSSAQSFVGNPGQSNYAAGSTFKDAFALSLNQDPDFTTVKVINWGYWGSVGIVSGLQYQQQMLAQGMLSIKPAQGMEAVTRVLAGPLEQVIGMNATTGLLSTWVDQKNWIEIRVPTYRACLDRVMTKVAAQTSVSAVIDASEPAFASLTRLAADMLLVEFRQWHIFGNANDEYSAAQLQSQLAILPEYQKLFTALLNILIKAGFIENREGVLIRSATLSDAQLREHENTLPTAKDAFVADFPAFSAYLNLLAPSLAHVGQVLRGDKNGTEVLFPDSSTTLVEAIYRDNPIADTINQAAALGVAAYVKERLAELPEANKLRILEVGAGTGGTSAFILQAIRDQGDRIEYVYTDISLKLVKYGEQHFASDFPFMQFRPLDIEQNIISQGFDDPFDLVIGANVLHATADIRTTVRVCKQLLRGNGWLLLNELTMPLDFATLTFGLLPGWWRFTDQEERLPDGPLLGRDMWQRLLKEEGFHQFASIGPEVTENLKYSQHILIAESNGLVRRLQQNPLDLIDTKKLAPAASAISSSTATLTNRVRAQVNSESQQSAPDHAHITDYIGERIIDCVEQALEIDRRKLDRDKQFSEYGVDSIIGIELINAINKAFAIELSTTTLFDYVTINALTVFIADSFGKDIASRIGSSHIDGNDSQLRMAHQDAASLVDEDERQFSTAVAMDSRQQTRSFSAHAEQVDDLSCAAAFISRPGTINDIVIRAIAPPEPDDHSVQILVKAASLNFGDLLSVKGLYPTMPPYPFVPGFEVAGIVIAIGSAVQRFHLGDEVFGLTGVSFGGHASIVNIPAGLLVKKPKNIDFAAASAIPVVFLTVYHALQIADLQPKEKILIQTAAGGVGLIAVQLAQLQGAEIYATAGSSRKLDYLHNLGVKNLINYQEQSFFEEIMRLTDGTGVDVVINTLAGDAIQKGIDLLAPGGRYLEIAMAGLHTSPTLDFSKMIDNQTFSSIDLRKLIIRQPQRLAAYMDAMVSMLTAGSLKPVVAKVFPFTQLQDAYLYLEERRNIGKVVIKMADHEQTTAVLPNAILRRLAARTRSSAMDIAIIGMAGKFPGSDSVAAFWQNLAAGHCAIKEVPGARWDIDQYYHPDPKNLDTTNCRMGGFLDDIDQFDPRFFGISGNEAELSDPQQRLFLETCWQALEDSGYVSKTGVNYKSGVFAGVGPSDYIDLIKGGGIPKHPQAFWGNESSIVPARISYFLDLKGPSISINTACSSSLVAIHMACQSILLGESDCALAGGVFVCTTPDFFILASNAEMLSPDGQCSAFDQNANGFVPGEGVGVIVLKALDRALQDHDHIYGVIKGSAVNQDGKTNGITAPSARSQTAVELSVYENFGINPRTIGYVETHGTGTKLGDPIEIEALTHAFQKFSDDSQYCALGSVKTNIGHSVMAAGVASVIKVLLALKHKQIPPSLNFDTENAHINFADSPFYVNTRLTDWQTIDDLPALAAISSFGFSGTNCHMVIASAPATDQQESPSRPYYLIVLSARKVTELWLRVQDLAAWLGSHAHADTLANIAYTLANGRHHWPLRLAFIVKDKGALKTVLDTVLNGDREDFIKSKKTPPSPATITATQRNPAFQHRVAHLLAVGNSADTDQKNYQESLAALADLYLQGVDLAWEALYENGEFYKLSLPTYPFIRQRYWIDDASDNSMTDDDLRTLLSRLRDGEIDTSQADRLLAEHEEHNHG